MTVYMVSDKSGTVALFSSREKAQDFIERKKYPTQYNITVWQVDDPYSHMIGDVA